MPSTVSEPPTEEHQLAAGSGLEFAMLAEAVRRHRAAANHPSEPKRPADHALYRALDELDR